jgi:hypothetical protein
LPNNFLFLTKCIAYRPSTIVAKIANISNCRSDPRLREIFRSRPAVPIKIRNRAQTKKHFWGEKIKDKYGFYHYGQEEFEMRWWERAEKRHYRNR